jgi:hypothetical protein
LKGSKCLIFTVDSYLVAQYPIRVTFGSFRNQTEEKAMEEKGGVVKLDKPGPNGGDLVLIIDFSTKNASLVEIAPQRLPNQKIMVWEVQDYSKVGS